MSEMIIEEHFYIPYYNEKRRVRILLPKSYNQSKNERFPVVYMHDGQNCFYDYESFAGVSWGVIDTLSNHKFKEYLVVAIDNNDEHRLDEYSPWQMDQTFRSKYGSVGGDGQAYAEWLVNTLKPSIDARFQTKSDKDHTLLLGSSMGGLITAYIGASYPNIFSTLGIFSLASWFNEPPFLTFCQNHPLLPTTKVFIQVGTNEGDINGQKRELKAIINDSQHYIDNSLNYYQLLLKQGHPINNIKLMIQSHETHHEKYWARHFRDFLDFYENKK
ncbi:hypothetical protein HMPREF9318_00020 [Streptococcus urinalis FB127-CNA-2]|uniref:Esterase n=1 Tax=Streptococcus urinalis 2285-97 TaxID=764291 RepID=G5KE45_9STRE|nr:putative esterase [Streptococcus urinalis 2285-97]EKS21822.1 hypothetical protein HMPREF9318_00020 [Streptococcus urinalis FB127-CNA-2]VEF31635.1 membrane-associated esterase [Streptococcus urinalis]